MTYLQAFPALIRVLVFFLSFLGFIKYLNVVYTMHDEEWQLALEWECLFYPYLHLVNSSNDLFAGISNVD